jgi:hypothetical protein
MSVQADPHPRRLKDPRPVKLSLFIESVFPFDSVPFDSVPFDTARELGYLPLTPLEAACGKTAGGGSRCVRIVGGRGRLLRTCF